MLSELYKSKEIDDCINRLVREDLRKDFKQELFVILCEQEERLKKINGNQVKFYVVRVILNLVSQTRNVFHKKYLNNHSELKDIKDESDLELVLTKNKLLDKLDKEVLNMDNHFGHFYYRALVQLVTKHGSIREAARQTGIPKSTISVGMRIAKNYLKDKISV